MNKVIPVKLLIFSSILILIVVVGTWWWSLTSRSEGNQYVEGAAAEPLHLLLLGDTGTGEENQYAVANAMERHCEQEPVTAIVILGDNFYQAGVASLHDKQWATKIFTPYGSPCLSRAPIYALLGNHDYRGNIKAQLAKGREEPRWVMPYRYYKVRHGNLLDLIVLDTQILDFCGVAKVCAYDFLRQELRRSKARWRIVAGHHPVRSASLKYRETWSLRGWALERELCGRADAYVAGHAHHLEHHRRPECATDFFISGGGGADLYGVNKKAPMPFKKSTHGFLSLVATEKELLWRFLDKDNNELHRSVQTLRNQREGG